jgi:hypothetical protein
MVGSLLISNLVPMFDLIILVVIMTSLRSWRVLMWCFCQQSLLQLRSHSYFLSHTLMGSIYLCYVKFSLVTFGNGVMTNDRWCRDETESLLWCTHGWAARHVLVSRLIVMIHHGTTPMCYLWWKFSQNDRCILSQHAAIFYPNLSSLSCQIPSHEFASIFSMRVTCFSTLKDSHSNLGTRFFLRGEGCDTPDVYFALCREINPNFGCSVKISISRSCLSLFIRLSLGSSPNSKLIDREKQPIFERAKTFISRNECKLENHPWIINLIWSHLIKLSTAVIWSEPESDSSSIDLCPTILSESVLLNGILSMSPSN